MTNLMPFGNRRKGGLWNRQNYLYNMLDDFFNDDLTSLNEAFSDSFKLDVESQEDKYIVSAELPGVKKDEVNLNFVDGRLLISVEREESKETEEKNYIHKERRHASSSRSVYLGDGTADGINAKLDGGILKVVVPRVSTEKNQGKIEIE